MQQIRLAVLRYEVTQTDALRESAIAILPKGQTEWRGKSAARRAAFFAGRSALASALCAEGWRGVVRPDLGYGFLRCVAEPGSVECFGNISHTESIAIAAVGPSPVGIDIERWDRDASRVITRVASEVERSRANPVTLDGEAVPPAVALWSAKEALSKATGLGISFGMQAFELDLSGASPYAVNLKVAGPLSLEDPAVVFMKVDDYVVSVCGAVDLIKNSLTIFSASQ